LSGKARAAFLTQHQARLGAGLMQPSAIWFSSWCSLETRRLRHCQDMHRWTSVLNEQFEIKQEEGDDTPMWLGAG